MKKLLHFCSSFCAVSVAVLLGVLSLRGLAGSDDASQEQAPRYGLVWEDDELLIRFSEPVVGSSVVENTQRQRGSEAERGLDLFTVSGSPAPSFRWVDQNELCVDFAPGSSPQDSFRLEFKPGTAYLGGKPVEPASYTFSPRPVSLRVRALPDHAGGAVLLSAAESDSREAQALANAHGGLTVRFRRMRNVPMLGWVEMEAVPATMRPATLADGTAGDEAIVRALIEKVPPHTILPTTPLPQTLIALPAHPLTPGAHYCVEIEAAPGSGFASLATEPQELARVLGTSLECRLEGEDGTALPHPHVQLRFDAPVAEDALRSLWGKMDVELAGQAATWSAESQCYRAVVGGKPVALRLLRLLPNPDACEVHTDKGCFYRVGHPHSAAGLEMELEADAPLELALTLPEGFRAVHGLVPQARRLALRVLPAWPLWQGTGNVVPLDGSHQLRLPALNTGEVTVSLHHWDAEAAARLFPLIRRARRDDSLLLELACRLGWLRQNPGLWLPGRHSRSQIISYTQEALKQVRADRRAQLALRRRIFAEGHAFPAVPLAQEEQGGDAFVSRGELLLDLDAAAGGAENLRPGLYLVRLCSRPSEAVHAELAALPSTDVPEAEGGTDDPLGCQVEYLVQVTDIGLHHGNNRLFVNNLADGEPLEGVNATAYHLDRTGDSAQEAARIQGQPLALPQGEAAFDAAFDGKLLLLQRGDDYRLAIAPSPYRHDKLAEDTDRLRLVLFRDRPLYRPGETVQLRGVLRDMSGEAPALPQPGEVELTVRRPNGEVLETRKLALDPYGAVSADIRLPGGEEDVTGGYTCELRAGEVMEEEYIPCEVFRRDAFKLEVTAEADPVAPKELCVRVRATNYDGTPLGRGKVKLALWASEKLFPLEAGEKTTVAIASLNPDGTTSDEAEVEVSADDPIGCGPRLADTLRVDKREVELELDAEGCAEYRASIAPLCYVPTTSQVQGVRVAASAANEREEWVRAGARCTFSPADFRIKWGGTSDRLRLMDVRSGQPLAREQKLQLTVRPWEGRWAPLAPGIEMHVAPDTIVPGETDAPDDSPLLQQEITVPANSLHGLDLRPLLAPLAGKDMRMQLQLRGRDSEGRTLEIHRNFHPGDMASQLVRFDLAVQGDSLCIRPLEDWGGARLHAFVSSQGHVRHALAERAEDGTWTLPLQADEYGDIQITLLRCRPGENGGNAHWSAGLNICQRPRPDKLLSVELTLPQGAKPGEAQRIGGRVVDAAGRPQRAGVTLFAVDAGMMSVAPYTLPKLASRFYRGETPYFSLGWQERPQRRHAAARPMGLMQWGLPPAEKRGLWEGWKDWHFYGGIGTSANDSAEECYRNVMWEHGEPVGFAFYADGLGASGVGLGMAACSMEAVSVNRPRLRSNFAPVALWQGCIETAEDGSFSCETTLPDTLTTYRVIAIALGADGSSFGQTEGEFLVNQELMLTAGTPYFMSLGDKLQLPLTITNNSEQAGSWSVALEGAGEPQTAHLAAGETKTLYFDVEAREEGEHVLRWTATNETSGDAVEARIPVLYPAPLLKEHHRLVLEEGDSLDTANLLAAELAGSTRGSISLEYATSPLLHLSGAYDYLLSYPYGCTEQTASALLPWLYHRHLAPYCPQMAQADARQAAETVRRGIAALLARQQADGGLSYWGSAPGETHPGSPWASAYAGLVLTIAQERGHDVPDKALTALRRYLDKQDWKHQSPLIRYAAARTCGHRDKAQRILEQSLRDAEKAGPDTCPGTPRSNLADLRFIVEINAKPAARHDALLRWLRSQGRDYRHPSTWTSGWQLIALGEYLKHEAQIESSGSLAINGETQATAAAPQRIEWKADGTLAARAPQLAATQGRTYVTLKVKAQPERTDYPGVTEHGLQVTRSYETKGADGLWHESRDWKVGDIVRVTLTCAKAADELEYLVLEDKLPSCLEAINPRVPSQAVGLENDGWGEWSPCIDHKEYLADRVRAFSTRWPGRELLNMRYYARVKRAGEAIAPPAEAQLMYEPQTYGLSPNERVRATRD